MFSDEALNEEEMVAFKNKQLEKELGLDDDDDDDSEEDEEESDEESEEDVSSEEDTVKNESLKHQDIKLKIHDALSQLREVEKQNLGDDDSGNESEREENNDEQAWKSDIAQKASEAFYKRQSGTTSLRKLVYGVEEKSENSESEDEDEIGGLFKVVSKQQSTKRSKTSAMDDLDSTKFTLNNLQNWEIEDIRRSIEDCFVTGEC